MQALEANPDNDNARFDLVKLLISMGQLKTASTVLAPCLSQIPLKLRFEALKQWLDAWAFVTTDPMGQWPLEKFDELIAANKRDFDARYAKARVLLASDDWTGAMDELLEIIMRDKKWNDEAARKTMVGLLELLTPVAPKGGADHTGKTAGGIELMGKSAIQEDPQAAMVSSYRRKLSMMLN
jgi:putative thioredoxin